MNSETRYATISVSNVNAAIELWMQSMRLIDKDERISAIRNTQDGVATFTELEMIIEKVNT